MNYMRTFISMKPLIVYSQNGIPLPKGDPVGKGNAVFLLSPNENVVFNEIQSGFIQYKKGLYKRIMIDFVYKDKIGFKKVNQNKTGVFRKLMTEHHSDLGSLTPVTNGNRASTIKQKMNVLVNLGYWNSLYFQYQRNESAERRCQSYFEFLHKRICNTDFENYDKVVYIDLDDWFSEGKPLSLGNRDLTNPISLLLTAARKFPQSLNLLNSCTFIFASMGGNKVMKVPVSSINKKTYSTLKRRICSMIPKSHINESSMMEDEVDDMNKDAMTTDQIVSHIVEKQQESELQQRIRRAIIADMTKELLGSTPDITKEEGFEDSENGDEPVITDDSKVKEMEGLANSYIDEHPELLNTRDITVASKEVKDAVKKKYYVREYTPKYTNKQLEKMQQLSSEQAATIGVIEESFADLESKIIDVSDVSDIVDTHNPNIVETKFNNFDRSYNKKKLQKDIDNAVGQLSNASTKVYVVGKEEEDSSTQRDLKKTLTYHLVDEKGKKMTLKFDVPVIFDDHYMYIKGNKKMLTHQWILKPIVKTGKDAVQIATNYKKMRIVRKGQGDIKGDALLKYIRSNVGGYKVTEGNAYPINTKYHTTVEFDSFSRKLMEFAIRENRFILDLPLLFKEMDKNHIKYDKINLEETMVVGFNTVTKKPLTIRTDDSFFDFVISFLSNEERVQMMKNSGKSNGNKRLACSTVKVLNKTAPLILILLYFEGFTKVMKKANIEFKLLDKVDGHPSETVDLYEWGLTELDDGYIKWKRNPSENSLLMNGLNSLPMYLYGKDELESKNTYMYLLTTIYTYANQAFNLDQFYDFMIDPITKEVLGDLKLPQDLVSLCILANKMLKFSEYSQESDLKNVRLRSNEVIPYHIYQAITDAYHKYRTTQHRKKPSPIVLKQDAVIKRLLKQPASVMTDASVNHPVMDASHLHSVNYRGEDGLNMDHAYNMNIRGYNESMLGVCGITTSNDANVGIKRQLTLDPNITSTRGYVDVCGKANLDNLDSSKLLTPMEMLTPLGVQHDDPTRTTMAFKQTTNMVPTHESDSVLIGNGMEKVLPYHISSEFSIVSEDDGIIVDRNEEAVVIKYKNGKYRTVDISPRIRKNSSTGSYVLNQMECAKQIGDKVKKNEVVAWDKSSFTANPDKGCSMNTGPLVKIAIIPEWDVYEDSAPISQRAATALTSTVVMPIEVRLTKDALISETKKIGDKVEAGESVIRYDNYREDPDMVEILQSLREEFNEDIIENSQTTEKSHFSGKIVDIKVVSSVPLDEMSDSCRKFVSTHWNRSKKKIKFLEKYSNDTDLKYYKSGNLIENSPEPVSEEDIKYDGIIVTYFVAYDDVMARGDKLASEFALKSIDSHVIEPGLEPRSEFQPEKPIDLIVAPLSITARKTPSIFLAMFGNKILMYAKDAMKEYWENN